MLVSVLGDVIYNGQISYSVETGDQRIPIEAISTTDNSSLTYAISSNPPYITLEGNEIVISYNGDATTLIIEVILIIFPIGPEPLIIAGYHQR